MWTGRLPVILALLLLSACATRQPEAVSAGRQAVAASLTPAVLLDDVAGQTQPIEARMARFDTPGVSVAVIRDGRIDWVGTWGQLGADDTGPVRPDTPFQASSVSKLVTAVGALRLVDQGRLALDTDVNTVLSGWTLPTAAGDPVTLRRLLSHTAGVNVSGFDGYAVDAPVPDLLQILNGESPANSPAVAVEHPSGTYRYSGGGYEVVQLLMQQAAGVPFDSVMQTLVLTPGAMTRSTYALNSGRTDPAPARGHGYDGTPIADGARLYPEHAAAGLWSTPTDLARLAIMLMRDWRGESVLLAPDTVQTMLTPVDGHMGLGAGVHGAGDDLHFDHAGWNTGFRVYLLAFPARGDGIVVMANADGADVLINEIVRSAARVYGWPGFEPQHRRAVAVDVADLEALAGSYRMIAGFDADVRAAGDHLVLATPRGSTYNFYPLDSRRFVAVEDGSELIFNDEGPGGLRLWGMTGTRNTP